MPRTPLGARHPESTRDRVVSLLRRANHTVDELAAELGITDNAVRLHLAALERDGFVRSGGVRRDGAVGKPATIYEIDPAAEPTFSRAYLPFVSALLAALSERLSVRELRALMRDVGRRLVTLGGVKPDRTTLATRAEAASRALNELGGLTAVERAPSGRGFVIRGAGCPLSVAVGEREEVCLAVQAMLTEITGTEVRAQCKHAGDRPSCCFEVG